MKPAQAGTVGQVVEVTEKAKRRQFTAAYKLEILKKAEACKKDGELGALLRIEGLYSSHLSAWRAARAVGGQAGLTGAKRGPKTVAVDPRDKQLVEKQRELAYWKVRAERAEAVVEIQKKVAVLLGIDLPENRGKRE